MIPSDQPGGRHDNDNPDFRAVVIVPTLEEVTCADPPYLPPLAAVEAAQTEEAREALTLDRQFRLLREDAVAPLREEVLKMQSPGGLQGRALLRNLRVVRVEADEKRFRASVLVRVDLPPRHKGRGISELSARKEFWGGPVGAGLLKRDSLVRGAMVSCLCCRSCSGAAARNTPSSSALLASGGKKILALPGHC